MIIKFDKNKIYLLACSFGPDSMALFDMLCKNNVNFVCCHVNYHKRDVSNFEENSLREYCKVQNITLEVLDASKFEQNGNFQGWARNLRYEFFKLCYQKYNAAGLFVAHQQDDLLETYLIQKRRKAYVTQYGLLENSMVLGMNVIRPLLCFTKKELEDYDKKNSVPYSIDISNLSDFYERNRIRHSVIEKMDLNKRKALLNEINFANKKLSKKRVAASKIVLSVDVVKKLNNEEYSLALFNVLNSYGVYSLSNSKVMSLKNLVNSDKSNIMVKVTDSIYYCQEYGDICIFQKQNQYNYVLNRPGKYSFEEFEIDFSYAEDRNIRSNDYPVIIRCPKKNDKYKIKNYYSSVNRLFIDWKMPKHLRNYWPVIENKDGDIIYIPRYRKDYVDNHKSLFMIKMK